MGIPKKDNKCKYNSTQIYIYIYIIQKEMPAYMHQVELFLKMTPIIRRRHCKHSNLSMWHWESHFESCISLFFSLFAYMYTSLYDYEYVCLLNFADKLRFFRYMCILVLKKGSRKVVSFSM